MTFACPNYSASQNATCRRLAKECVPGRNGCVLDSEVKLSPHLQKRLQNLGERNRRFEACEQPVENRTQQNP